MNKAELIRHEIEKRRDHNLAIGNPLFAAMAEEDIELLSFIDSLQEESVSEDLMDATNNYCVNVRKGYPRVMDETDRYICNAFKAGAKWQKEQMIAKALPVEIDSSRSDGRCILSGNFARFGTGDKVKVIIIKED